MNWLLSDRKQWIKEPQGLASGQKGAQEHIRQRLRGKWNKAGKRMVRGGGRAQYAGFLGMLASIGVPFTTDLIGKIFGKGLHVVPPPPKGGKGIYINVPPFFGSWGDNKKNGRFDLINWCKYFNISIKGILSRNETSSSFAMYYQHGRFWKHGHSLGFLLVHKKRWPWILWLFWSAAAYWVEIRTVKSQGKEEFSSQLQTVALG